MDIQRLKQYMNGVDESEEQKGENRSKGYGKGDNVLGSSDSGKGMGEFGNFGGNNGGYNDSGIYGNSAFGGPGAPPGHFPPGHPPHASALFPPAQKGSDFGVGKKGGYDERFLVRASKMNGRAASAKGSDGIGNYYRG